MKVFHHHIHMSGSERIDAILHQRFPGRVIQVQSANGVDRLTGEQVAAAVAERPECEAAMSSCTPLLSAREKVAAIHVSLLRHPASRLMAMFEFDLGQDDRQGPTAVAKDAGFSGYTDWWLQDERAVMRNWQMRSCTPQQLVGDTGDPEGVRGDLAVAMYAVRHLALVGTRERFDEFCVVLEFLCRQGGFAIDVAASADALRASPGSTPDEVKNLLGHRLYQRFLDANAEDLQLHTHAEGLIQERLTSIDPEGRRLTQLRDTPYAGTRG